MNKLEKLKSLFSESFKDGERILTESYFDTPEIMLKRGIISQETYDAAILALEKYNKLHTK